MTVLMARGPRAGGCGHCCARGRLMVADRPGPTPHARGCRARRQRRISSWWPDSRTSGHPPAAVLGRARVVRVLGVAAERRAEGLLGGATRRGRARPAACAARRRTTTIAASSPPDEHVAADRDGVRREVLDDALVEALVAAAQQRERRLGRELVDEAVVEHAARPGVSAMTRRSRAQVDRVDARRRRAAPRP